MLPVYFNGIFESSVTPHAYNTRNRHELQAGIPRTVSAAKAIRYAAPAILQNTPNTITEKILVSEAARTRTKKYFALQILPVPP